MLFWVWARLHERTTVTHLSRVPSSYHYCVSRDRTMVDTTWHSCSCRVKSWLKTISDCLKNSSSSGQGYMIDQLLVSSLPLMSSKERERIRTAWIHCHNRSCQNKVGAAKLLKNVVKMVIGAGCIHESRETIDKWPDLDSSIDKIVWISSSRPSPYH